MSGYASILSETAHRQWAVPDRPWAMGMKWRDLLFAHWAVDLSAIRASVPEGLEIDTFGGRAWVGLVPFRMVNVRHRLLPAIPGLRAFPELNLRTYVTIGGKPGVYFWSLDATNRPAIETARALFGLNYLRARMRCEREGEVVRYESVRADSRGPEARLACRYEGEGDVFAAEPGSLESFLTDRLCLYAERGSAIWRGEIHHKPWRLRRARWDVEVCEMFRLAGVALDREPDSLMTAEPLEVAGWMPREVR